MKKTARFVLDVISGTIRDNVTAYSAHAAFFVTISFIPFIMLMISVIRFLPFTKQELIKQAVTVFPQAAQGFVTSFVREAYTKSGSAVISITAITTLWPASIGIFSLVKGISRVYSSVETKNYLIIRITSIFYTVVLMILLLLCLGIFVFGKVIIASIEHLIPSAVATFLSMSVHLIGAVTVMSLIFAAMFTFIPDRKGKFSLQLPGALVSSAGWIVFSSVFSYYYENISNYSYLYGSLSILVFFMIWLYGCIFILLVGAEINKCIEDRLSEKL